MKGITRNYHDGSVEAIDDGPRREVVLHVRLDPVWNGGDASVRRVRISAMENFSAVAAVLHPALPSADRRAADEVVSISIEREGVTVELARAGRIVFHGARITEP